MFFLLHVQSEKFCKDYEIENPVPVKAPPPGGCRFGRNAAPTVFCPGIGQPGDAAKDFFIFFPVADRNGGLTGPFI